MQTNSIRLPWKPIKIVPVGDIQLGAGGVSMDTLARDVQRGLANDAWFIGMGDYVDSMSPSGRRKYASADFYDSTIQQLNKGAEKDIEQLWEILEPTKGKWLGLHQGHHYHDFKDGSTTDTRLATMLGCPFLGDSAFTRITFKRGQGTARQLTLYSTHGEGSGQTQSAPLSKLEKVAGGISADLYLINHYARKGAQPADVLYMDDRGHINHRTVYYIATGGYMGAYVEGSHKDGRAQGSYVEKAMLKPTTLGGVMISATPTRWRENGLEYNEIITGVEL